MVRGIYEMKKENEKMLQEYLTHFNEGKSFMFQKWHTTFIVRNKRLIATDRYSLKILLEMTGEDWRIEHSSNEIYSTPRIDFFR